jgi:hypothetical protein
MLFIDNELSKVFQNSSYSDLFIESLKDISCLKNEVQWLYLVSHLWLTLIKLPLAI